ncbi:MAG: tetratricopeptide repeat protein, partial [Planctomycetota bacterium]
GIIHFYLANLVKKKGADPRDHYLSAVDNLTKAAEMDPSYAYVFKDLGVCRVALARIGLAKGERPRDLLRRAIGDLTVAIELNPMLYGAFYERGMAFFSMKQFGEAIADWRKCLELDPTKKGHLQPLIDESKQKLAKQG